MGIEDDIVFLEQVGMLRLLGRQALRILAIGAESRYVHGGEVLFRAGEVADAGYMVQEGSFALSAHIGIDRATTAGPGSLLGEFALLTETPRPFTATATEPSSVIRIPRTLFLKMLEGYPDAAQRLRDHLVARSEQTMQDMQKVRKVLDPDRGR